MEYRKLPHGEERISILGLGTSSIGAAGEDEIQATVELALEKGCLLYTSRCVEETALVRGQHAGGDLRLGAAVPHTGGGVRRLLSQDVYKRQKQESHAPSRGMALFYPIFTGA